MIKPFLYNLQDPQYINEKEEEQKQERLINKETCPICQKKMNCFSGLKAIPAGLYCPKCNDAIYDEEGNVLCKLE